MLWQCEISLSEISSDGLGTSSNVTTPLFFDKLLKLDPGSWQC